MAQGVRRAAEIIDTIADGPRTVAELAGRFGVHRSTMFRQLQSLEDVRFVRRRQDGAYTLGLHFIAMAQTALESIDLREAASAHARRLHEIVGNTVHVTALMDDSLIYVDKIEDAGGVRMYSRVGAPVRPQCSAAGKVILAYLDTPRRDAVLAGTEWKRFTKATITDRSDLDAELDTISARGWAADNGEFEDFINCVAVPIHSVAGIVGALSLTAIRLVDDLPQLRVHLPVMRQTADRIAGELE